jgi:hypothetical protein
MIKVSKIEAIDGYKVRVRFTDDSVGEYDFSTMLTETGPMIEPLRDGAYFRRVFLEFGALTWPNGFDVAPEWLYHEIEAAGALIRTASA